MLLVRKILKYYLKLLINKLKNTVPKLKSFRFEELCVSMTFGNQMRWLTRHLFLYCIKKLIYI